MKNINNKIINYIWQTSILLSLSIGINISQNIYLEKNNEDNLKNYKQQENISKIQIKIQQKIPDFGFGNLFADWNFLQFIQYYGDGNVRKKTGYSLIPEYFLAIANKDPYFVKAYLILSSSNSIYAGQPELTVEFLNKVLNSIPPGDIAESYYLWSYKGIDEILFLGDIKAAQKSFETGAEWALYRKDELGEKIAERNKKTAKFLASNPDASVLKISAWSMILANAHDHKTQNYILNKLKGLGAEITVSPDGKLEIKPPNQA